MLGKHCFGIGSLLRANGEFEQVGEYSTKAALEYPLILNSYYMPLSHCLVKAYVIEL